MFKNIDSNRLSEKLDLDFDKGGAGWNKVRAMSFTERTNSILAQANSLNVNQEENILTFCDYLVNVYHLHLTEDVIMRFRAFIKLRVENKIDRFGLQQRLDASKSLGGVGLYKGSAEKVVREVELIMLLKYSA